MPTLREWIGIMNVVLEPEAISELEIVKLPGQDAGERGSKKCSGERVFRDTGRPQVYVIHITARQMHTSCLTVSTTRLDYTHR